MTTPLVRKILQGRAEKEEFPVWWMIFELDFHMLWVVSLSWIIYRLVWHFMTRGCIHFWRGFPGSRNKGTQLSQRKKERQLLRLLVQHHPSSPLLPEELAKRQTGILDLFFSFSPFQLSDNPIFFCVWCSSLCSLNKSPVPAPLIALPPKV